MNIKSVYHAIVPESIRKLKSDIKERLYWEKKGRFIREKILNKYGPINDGAITDEEREVVGYLKKNKITLLPYNFPDNYHESDIKVLNDREYGFKYVIHKGKRLYFKKKWSKRKIKKYYNYLLVEQDISSPHRYLTSCFKINPDAYIVDAGAAEGIFTLDNIEKASAVTLFEPDKDWVDALRLTFKPYAKKITIVDKYLSSSDTHHSISIDCYLPENTNIDFIKIDVEGSELDALRGAEKALVGAKNPLMIAVCTYHKQNDEILLKDYLESLGFKCEYSKGYIPFFYDKDIDEPYLRRCLIRAVKC